LDLYLHSVHMYNQYRGIEPDRKVGCRLCKWTGKLEIGEGHTLEVVCKVGANFTRGQESRGTSFQKRRAKLKCFVPFFWMWGLYVSCWCLEILILKEGISGEPQKEARGQQPSPIEHYLNEWRKEIGEGQTLEVVCKVGTNFTRGQESRGTSFRKWRAKLKCFVPFLMWGVYVSCFPPGPMTSAI
jgi:hypothetical protein